MSLPPVVATVWIDGWALGFIESEALASRGLETGGGLFGWSSESGTVIACAFGPGRNAIRTRSTLETDRDHAQEIITAVHLASQGRYRFLGSWHSHPSGPARPSETDCLTAHSMANDPSVRLARPVLLVVAMERRGWPHRSNSHLTTRAFLWDFTADRLREAALVRTQLPERHCPP